MIEIRLFDSLDNESLRRGWDSIYNERNLSPQFSYIWISNWWKLFRKPSRTPWVVVVVEDNDIIAIAPFMIEKIGCLRQVKFLGSGLQDSHEFLVRSGCEEVAIPAIMDFLLKSRDFNLINLEQVPDDSALYRDLSGDSRFRKRMMTRCPLISLGGLSWEEFFGRFSRNFRKEWAKKHRRLSAQGRLKLVCMVYGESRQAWLEAAFNMHIKHWSRQGQVSKLGRTSIRDFIQMTFAALPGSTLYLLLLDDKLIAYRIGFSRKGVFYAWNSSYMDAFESFSVGFVFFGLIIQDLIQKGFRTVNFMRGDYSYKRRWMVGDNFLSNYQFLKARRSLTGILGERYYFSFKWWIKRCLKRIIESPSTQNYLIGRRH